MTDELKEKTKSEHVPANMAWALKRCGYPQDIGKNELKYQTLYADITNRVAPYVSFSDTEKKDLCRCPSISDAYDWITETYEIRMCVTRQRNGKFKYNLKTELGVLSSNASFDCPIKAVIAALDSVTSKYLSRNGEGK